MSSKYKIPTHNAEGKFCKQHESKLAMQYGYHDQISEQAMAYNKIFEDADMREVVKLAMIKDMSFTERLDLVEQRIGSIGRFEGSKQAK